MCVGRLASLLHPIASTWQHQHAVLCTRCHRCLRGGFVVLVLVLAREELAPRVPAQARPHAVICLSTLCMAQLALHTHARNVHLYNCTFLCSSRCYTKS